MTDTARFSNLYLSSIPNASASNLLYYNSGTDVVSYDVPAALGFSQAFNVGSPVVVLPAAPTSYTFINLSTADNGTFNDGGILNLASGQISINATGNYLVSMNVEYENNSADVPTQDAISLIFYNVTDAVSMYTYDWEVIQNDVNSYTWSNVFRLTSGKVYEFQFTNTLAGSTGTISTGQFTRLSLQRLT